MYEVVFQAAVEHSSGPPFHLVVESQAPNPQQAAVLHPARDACHHDSVGLLRPPMTRLVLSAANGGIGGNRRQAKRLPSHAEGLGGHAHRRGSGASRKSASRGTVNVGPSYHVGIHPTAESFPAPYFPSVVKRAGSGIREKPRPTV